MRFLLYSLNFAPELTGIGKYSGEMAAWLAAQGHRVQVVCAAPYYPEWKLHAGFGGLRWRKQQLPVAGHGLLQVSRCPLWVPRRVSGLKRLVHLLTFAATSFIPLARALASRPDVVVVIAPALLVTPQALLLARMAGVPTWLHVQDFEVDAALDMGIVRAGWLGRAALQVEGWVLRHFDRVSTISLAMRERLLRKGVTHTRTRLFPNWVDTDSIFPLDGANPYRDQLRLSAGQVLVLYAGNMGEKQGLDVVIDAARLLAPHGDIQFLMVGTGAACERLQRSAADLANITWWPLQPVARLNELLNAADIHVLPQRADAADLVMPSKLGGMLASGKPVLGTSAAATELGRVLDAVGARVAPGDTTALAATILRWAADGPARLACGEAGRRFAVANLALDPIMATFCSDAESLVQASCTTTNS